VVSPSGELAFRALRFPFHRHHFGTHVGLAAVLALCSAAAFAVAIVVQQRAAAQVSDEDARSGQIVGHLLRSRQWVMGTVSNAAGYALQAVALAYGSLLVVQPLLVCSLLIALPLEARLAHRRLPRSVWVWGLLLAVTLAVFVSLGNPNNGTSHARPGGWLAAGIITAGVLAGCLVVAARRTGAARASALAVVVGVLGGGLAILTKAVVGLLRRSVTAPLTHWELYALLVVGGAGIYLQQLSFQAGSLSASLPIITVLEPLVAATVGLVLLHEKLRVTGPVLGLLMFAVAIMIVATVALARGRAALEAAPPPVPD
jgi:drug/metabolite transporter (DMT)-like permease